MTTDIDRDQLRKVTEALLAGDTSAQDEFTRLATPEAVIDLFKGIDNMMVVLASSERRR